MTIERVQFDLDRVEPPGSVAAVPRPTMRLVDEPPPLVEAGRMRLPTEACRYGSWPLVAKRVLDRALALVAAIALLPLMLVVAVAVKATSRGPVLFAQTRIGRGGRPFTIYKFRTMRPDAEAYLAGHPELAARYRANDFKLPLAEDVRVTRLGRVLRRTSLDELPQLINILRGDMSFVGPRPVLPEELSRYGDYRGMYEVAYPGLTGAWQVAGGTDSRYPARARLDADYVEGWSLLGDLSIMVRTIPALLDADRTG